VSVASFGAVGDGKADDTPAFQAALDEAGKTGGIVAVPAGSSCSGGALWSRPM
jgi:polygalacturonase